MRASRILLLFAILLSAKAFAVEPINRAMEIPEGELGTLIYQGTKSVAGEFPVAGWIGMCTATAVAPNVIFTAAHCIGNGQRVTFEHRGSNKNYAATCYKHPRYNNRTTYNDYAACVLDGSLPEGSALASFKLESPEVSEVLLLNGFGRPNIRVHYWGEGTVRRISGQDIVTCGKANLGSGDSGGSLLSWTNDRTGAGGFDIYGVNSRAGGGCSYFNRTSHDEFIAWAKDFEGRHGVELCGISANCKEPPAPIDCEGLYANLGLCLDVPAEGCEADYRKFSQCVRDAR